MTAQRDSEAAISREIADFCGAMGDGDFSRRIDLAGKEGVFRDLSQQLNTLADTMQGMMSDLGHVLGGLAAGDLARKTSGSSKGAFATLADAARDTLARLRDFTGRLPEPTDTARTAPAELPSGSQTIPPTTA